MKDWDEVLKSRYFQEFLKSQFVVRKEKKDESKEMDKPLVLDLDGLEEEV